MNGCENCKDVNIESGIRGPAEFDKALRIVRANLDDGTIVETSRECSTPLIQVNGAGPYTEDIYLYHFECPKCKLGFKLSCNTYHGSGGEWKPLKDRDL